MIMKKNSIRERRVCTIVNESLIEHDTDIFQEISSVTCNGCSSLRLIARKGEGGREIEGGREGEMEGGRVK